MATRHSTAPHRRTARSPKESPAPHHNSKQNTAEAETLALQQAVADPQAATPAALLHLQRLHGNRAVSRLIQTKLTVGAAGDQYEQEADRTADAVLAVPGPATGVQRAGEEEEEPVQAKPLMEAVTRLAQRSAEEEEPLQAKALQRAAEEEEELQAKPLQRAAEEEELQAKPLQRAAEEEELQMKPAVSPQGSFAPGQHFEGRLAAQQGRGQALPNDTRHFMERRFGADFSAVRVHTGGEAAVLNRQIYAQAFTHGNNIFFGAGKYDPGTAAGKRLLAHELTHTIQQTGGAQRQVAPRLSRSPSRNVVQAKLLTAKEFAAQAAIERRGFFGRLFSGDSYDKLLGFLQEYEKLIAKDKDGKELNKRLAVLKDIEDSSVKAFNEYEAHSTKGQQDQAKKPTKKLDKRQQKVETVAMALMTIQDQVREERESILGLKVEGRMKGMDHIKGTGKVKNQDALKTSAEQEAETAQVENKGIMAKLQSLGKKVSNFFSFAFGGDFNPQAIASYRGELLGVEEILDIVKITERALEIRKKILDQQKEPKDPARAMALAFQHLPEQLTPKTADPEEFIVIKTRVQMLKDAKNALMASYVKSQQESTSKEQQGKFKFYANKGLEAIKGNAKEGLSQGLDTAAEKTDERAGKLEGIKEFKEGERNDFFMSGGQKKDLKEKYSGTGGDEKLEQDIGDAKKISGITGFVKSFKDLLTGIVEAKELIELMQSQDPVVKSDAKGKFAVKVVELLTAGTELSKAIGTALEGWAVEVGKMVPILSVVVEFLNVVKGVVEGIVRWSRLSKEEEVLKEAKGSKEGQGLAGAIGSFKDRNTTLSLRNGAEMIISAVKMVAEILKAIPGANLAGLIVGTVATVVSGLKAVGQYLQESYRAGLRQETERKTESGQKGSAKKVLENSPVYAATAIILEAKDGNPIAIKELGVYGLGKDDLKDKSVEELRAKLLEEMQEELDPKTITQKLMSVGYAIGIDSARVV